MALIAKGNKPQQDRRYKQTEVSVRCETNKQKEGKNKKQSKTNKINE